jgi:two-component system OmpR family sensor kinase
MNRTIHYLSVGLLVIGILALVFMPQLLVPEPILVLRIGTGASIFILLFFIAFLLQMVLIGKELSRKEFKIQLNKANRHHEQEHLQFIRRLDHEIKNPLTGLQTAFANFAEAGEEGEQNQAKENFYKALERLTRLLRDLRKIYDLDSQLIEQRPIDISQLVKETVEATQALPVYEEREIKVLTSTIPWPLPLVVGDRDLLGLALYNLLENALKFSEQDEPVELRLREDGHLVFIEIADRGSGIPPDEQESIFEDLYRGSNARHVNGSGLGLSLVRRIVKLHSGEISLRSLNNHIHGSVFTLRLPTKNQRKAV